MDAVSQRAGVSKQTVYGHFANKDELFKACIRAKVAGYGFEETAVAPDQDLRRGLLVVAHRFIDLLFDSEVIAMHRVVMGEAASHPRIAALFYESGPGRTRSAVTAFLRQQVSKGRLRISNDRLSYAAVQFLNTALGMYQIELMMGLRTNVPDDELNEHLERTVDDFLRLYAVS